jgi:hypothetical protein
MKRTTLFFSNINNTFEKVLCRRETGQDFEIGETSPTRKGGVQ